MRMNIQPCRVKDTGSGVVFWEAFDRDWVVCVFFDPDGPGGHKVRIRARRTGIPENWEDAWQENLYMQDAFRKLFGEPVSAVEFLGKLGDLGEANRLGELFAGVEGFYQKLVIHTLPTLPGVAEK